MAFRRDTGAGFTLTELLVALSIVAVLAALALPALRSALDRADRVVCLSNLRQQGQAFQEFVADHGHFPAAQLDVTDESGRVLERRRWYHQIAVYLDAPAAAWSSGQGRASSGAVVLPSDDDRDQSPYPALFRCPRVAHWLVGRNMAYGYNHQRLGDARVVGFSDEGAPRYRRYPVTSAELADPSNTVLVADSDGTGTAEYRPPRGASVDAIGNHSYTLDPPWLPLLPGPEGPVQWGSDGHPAGFGAPTVRSQPSSRHRGGCCVLFVDGRVEWVPKATLAYTNQLWGLAGLDATGDSRHDAR